MKASFLIAALAAILVLAGVPAVSAVPSISTVFTTDTDFQGGTHNATDSRFFNGALASGTLELENGKGDAFARDDADATTFKWNAVTGVPCSGGTPGTIHREIGNGGLHLKWTAGGSPPIFGQRCFGATTDYTIRTNGGDIDVTTLTQKINFTGGGLDSYAVSLFVSNGAKTQTNCLSSPNGKGVFVELTFDASTGDMKASMRDCTIGFLDFVPIDNSTTFLCLRIKGHSGAWTGYFNPDCDASWTTITTSTETIPGTAFRTSLLLHTDFVNFPEVMTPPVFDYAFTDFRMAQGSVNFEPYFPNPERGYRKEGDWTSPLQPFAGSRPFSMTLNFSAALTGNNFLNFVRFVKANGDVMFQNTTDVTSGTEVTYTVTGVTKNWKVVVGLKNDNGFSASTPTLASITVLGTVPFTFDFVGWTALLVFVALLVLGLILAYRWKHRGEGG